MTQKKCVISVNGIKTGIRKQSSVKTYVLKDNILTTSIAGMEVVQTLNANAFMVPTGTKKLIHVLPVMSPAVLAKQLMSAITV